MQATTRFLIILGSALAAAALVLAGSPRAQDAHATKKLSLTAEGTVVAAPDMATLSLGVVSQADAAGAALADNSERMRKIIATLKEQGIADRDLQTSNFSISPIYTDQPPRRSGDAPVPPKIAGYRASNQLTVRIRDLAKVGSILDITVGVGANSISGPNFTVDDAEPLRDEARKAAIRNGRANAVLYADAAGVSLGPVRTIEELGQGRPPVMMARAEAAFDSAVPMEGGELTYTATVRMVWDIE